MTPMALRHTVDGRADLSAWCVSSVLSWKVVPAGLVFSRLAGT